MYGVSIKTIKNKLRCKNDILVFFHGLTLI